MLQFIILKLWLEIFLEEIKWSLAGEMMQRLRKLLIFKRTASSIPQHPRGYNPL